MRTVALSRATADHAPLCQYRRLCYSPCGGGLCWHKRMA